MYKYLRRLLEGTVIGHMGTCDANHQSFSTMCSSIAVIESPTRIVLHIPEAVLANVQRNLLVNNYIAILIADLVTYESVQLKGIALVRPATDEEQSYQLKKQHGIAEARRTDLLPALRKSSLMAVEMTIIEIYNQTPGSGAGNKLVFE